MRTHTKEKPFACAVDGCGYAAARKGDLASKCCSGYCFIINLNVFVVVECS